MFEDGIAGKKVLEAGSMDVNGSVRPLIEWHRPAEYIGVDIASGPGVDRICDVTALIDQFGPDRFDIVLATELMEHVRDWRTAVHNLKTVCKPGGTIILTTRSKGFPYHGYPFDFWRFETDDMKEIFRDCDIKKIEKDAAKGVFLKAVKPDNFVEQDLSGYELYSIVAGKKARELGDGDLEGLAFKRVVWKERLRETFCRIGEIISSKL